eukprot:TRINITY_DN32245_c0_g1_i1.p1 TRINITY_DN32245_c0_g1~~TRINITY_DN32245_c0_g1_i1.p1  ORF type:complete len:160 (+),score=28.41 TRINITY_DN32245_c0_g1_i1:120-599(+)
MAVLDVQQWFLDNGGRIADGIVVRDSPLGGNGLFLQGSAVPAETEILSIPLESCPSSSHESVADLPVNSLFRLCELLCVELTKRPNSCWEAWFASLPKQCGNWPEWREAELLSAQRGPRHFFEAAVDMAKKLPAWYAELSGEANSHTGSFVHQRCSRIC